MNSDPSGEEKPVEIFRESPPPVNWRKWGCFGSIGLVALVLLAGSIDEWPSNDPQIRRKKAMVMTVTLANAVEQFFADYDQLPLPQPAGPADQDTDTSATSGFIIILLGEEKTELPLNIRRIDYLDGFIQAKEDKKRKGEWIEGLFIGGGKHAVIDPWGKPFRVRLDMDNSGTVLNPDPEETAEGRRELRKRVIIWSAGPDGNFETWDDNPRSWE